MATRQIAAMLDKMLGCDRNNPVAGSEGTVDSSLGIDSDNPVPADEDLGGNNPLPCSAKEEVEHPDPASPAPMAKKQMVTWNHPDVCRHRLVQLCPHQLFDELGPCPKLYHDDHLRENFEQEADEVTKKEYENSFLQLCDEIFDSLSARIKRGKQRIAVNKMEKQSVPSVSDKEREEIEKAMATLTTRINVLVDEAQKACEEGDIVEAKEHLKLCDQLKMEREKHKMSMGIGKKAVPAEVENSLELCEICGSVLVVGPKEGREERREAHNQGKDHCGYLQIREAVGNLLNFYRL